VAVGDYKVGKLVGISLGGTRAYTVSGTATESTGTDDVTNSEGDGAQEVEPTIEKWDVEGEAVWKTSVGLPANSSVSTMVAAAVLVGADEYIGGDLLITSRSINWTATGGLRVRFSGTSSGPWTALDDA
jgi:hypothetical protein